MVAEIITIIIFRSWFLSLLPRVGVIIIFILIIEPREFRSGPEVSLGERRAQKGERKQDEEVEAEWPQTGSRCQCGTGRRAISAPGQKLSPSICGTCRRRRPERRPSSGRAADELRRPEVNWRHRQSPASVWRLPFSGRCSPLARQPNGAKSKESIKWPGF